jgi:hypothetical protein
MFADIHTGEGRSFSLECFPVVDTCFRHFPLENVEKMIFATHKYSAEELFSKIEPKYSDDETLQETQKLLFHEGLRDILIKWEKEDSSKLRRFLQFCSGRSFLSPDPHSRFKITLEFEVQTVEGNSSSADRLPESHTCVPCLSLPVDAYNGDFEELEKKLNAALEYFKIFTMQ